MKMLKRLATAMLALLPAALLAEDFTAGTLTISQPMAFETAPTAMAGGGYMTITNEGETSDRLIDVRAGYPRVEIHESFEEDGVARMRPVEALEIAPGETVALEPGGLHVMFMGLRDAPFVAGGEVPATLVFERAGEVEIVFDVLPRDASGSAASH